MAWTRTRETSSCGEPGDETTTTTRGKEETDEFCNTYIPSIHTKNNIITITI